MSAERGLRDNNSCGRGGLLRRSATAHGYRRDEFCTVVFLFGAAGSSIRWVVPLGITRRLLKGEGILMGYSNIFEDRELCGCMSGKIGSLVNRFTIVAAG